MLVTLSGYFKTTFTLPIALYPLRTVSTSHVLHSLVVARDGPNSLGAREGDMY